MDVDASNFSFLNLNKFYGVTWLQCFVLAVKTWRWSLSYDNLIRVRSVQFLTSAQAQARLLTRADLCRYTKHTEGRSLYFASENIWTSPEFFHPPLPSTTPPIRICKSQCFFLSVVFADQLLCLWVTSRSGESGIDCFLKHFPTNIK